MRKWHRWLSLFFGIFMLWIAATGLLSQAADLWPKGEMSESQAAASPPPTGWECPPGWRCRPDVQESGIRGLKGYFHHLHSGEEFGLVGQVISVLSGLALLFFAFSGLWMYVRMWRERAGRGAKRRWFW